MGIVGSPRSHTKSFQLDYVHSFYYRTQGVPSHRPFANLRHFVTCFSRLFQVGFPFFREDVALPDRQAAGMPIHTAPHRAGGNVKCISHRVDCTKACRELDPAIFLPQQGDSKENRRHLPIRTTGASQSFRRFSCWGFENMGVRRRYSLGCSAPRPHHTLKGKQKGTHLDYVLTDLVYRLLSRTYAR